MLDREPPPVQGSKAMRTRSRRLGAAFLAVTWLAACSAAVSAPPTPDGDAAAIRAALEQWPREWNDRNTEAVCGLFAPDVVLSCPPIPDRDFADGDLATVRLTWTSRTTGAGIEGERVEHEKGLDVFRRQPDGLWRIHVSHAYPEE
jgi:ketosteroid isomerase-like protein